MVKFRIGTYYCLIIQTNPYPDLIINFYSNIRDETACINKYTPVRKLVKFPYWGVLNYADNLCINISPIFYIANPKPNPTGLSTPQYGNYPRKLYPKYCKIEISEKTLNVRLMLNFTNNDESPGSWRNPFFS